MVETHSQEDFDFVVDLLWGNTDHYERSRACLLQRASLINDKIQDLWDSTPVECWDREFSILAQRYGLQYERRETTEGVMRALEDLKQVAHEISHGIKPVDWVSSLLEDGTRPPLGSVLWNCMLEEVYARF